MVNEKSTLVKSLYQTSNYLIFSINFYYNNTKFKMDKILNLDEIEKKEQEILKKASTDEYEYRLLEKGDYEKGFLDILSQLTVVGKPSK